MGDWPKVIVRTRDKDISPDERVRFIRIEGKTFRSAIPARTPSNGCEPHQVTVADFYIQETEITNGDIEEYLENYPEDKPKLAEWRDYYKEQKDTNGAKARRFAAAGINYAIAAEVRRRISGADCRPRPSGNSRPSRAADDYHWPWGHEGRRTARSRRPTSSIRRACLGPAHGQELRERQDRAGRLRHDGQRAASGASTLRPTGSRPTARQPADATRATRSGNAPSGGGRSTARWTRRWSSSEAGAARRCPMTSASAW